MQGEIPNAKCPQCGLIFPAPAFAGLTLGRGNRMGCPHCGTPSPVEDIAGGRVFGPRFVHDAFQTFRTADIYDLERLQRVADRARSGEISKQEAVQEVRDFGGGFGKLMQHPAAANWLALLGVLVAIYIAYAQKKGGDLDHRELIELLRRQAEASEELADQYNQARQACPDDLPPLQVAPRRTGESRQAYRHRLRLLAKGREI